MLKHVFLRFLITALFFMGTGIDMINAAKRSRDTAQAEMATSIFSTVGLINSTGSSCYINAVTQCLLHLPAFNAGLDALDLERLERLIDIENITEQEKDEKKNALLVVEAFRNIYISTQTSNDAVKTQNYHNAVIQAYFASEENPTGSRNQQDAEEFLTKFLNTLNDQRFTLFQRAETSAITCSGCTKTYEKKENSNILALPIVQQDLTSPSLSDLINHYLTEAALKIEDELTATGKVNDNRYECDICKASGKGKQNATKKLSFTFPPVLAIQLKRFTDIGLKNSTPVTIYPHFTVALNGKITTYRLHGIVYHHGVSAQFGHYTAAVKSATNWYHFNDESDARVISEQSIDSIGDGIPYLLMYVQDGIEELKPLKIHEEPKATPRQKTQQARSYAAKSDSESTASSEDESSSSTQKTMEELLKDMIKAQNKTYRELRKATQMKEAESQQRADEARRAGEFAREQACQQQAQFEATRATEEVRKKDHPTIRERIERGERNFAGQKLCNADLSNLGDVRDLNLTGANLTDANLSNSRFHHGIFTGAQMTNVVIENTLFDENTQLNGVILIPLRAFGACFDHANLEWVQCHNGFPAQAQGPQANFGCQSIISGSNQIQGGVVFANCNLNHANFYHALCRGIVFNQNDMSYTRFFNANLSYATISGRPSVYEDVWIDGGANLFHARLERIIFQNSVIRNIDLQEAVLIALRFHDCGTINDIDMSDISMNAVEFRSTRLLRVNCSRAHLNNILYISTGVIAEEVNFERAVLEYCIFAGLQYSNMRTLGLESLDQQMSKEKITSGVLIGGGCVVFLVGAGAIAICVFLPPLAVPFAAATTTVGEAAVATYTTMFIGGTAMGASATVTAKNSISLMQNNFPYPYANSVFLGCNFQSTHFNRCQFDYVIFKNPNHLEAIGSATGSLVTHCAILRNDVFSALNHFAQRGAKVSNIPPNQDYRTVWGDRDDATVAREIMNVVRDALRAAAVYVGGILLFG